MSADIRGCGTALITPFRRDGAVDYDALQRLTSTKDGLKAEAFVLPAFVPSHAHWLEEWEPRYIRCSYITPPSGVRIFRLGIT